MISETILIGGSVATFVGVYLLKRQGDDTESESTKSNKENVSSDKTKSNSRTKRIESQRREVDRILQEGKNLLEQDNYKKSVTRCQEVFEIIDDAVIRGHLVDEYLATVRLVKQVGDELYMSEQYDRAWEEYKLALSALGKRAQNPHSSSPQSPTLLNYEKGGKELYQQIQTKLKQTAARRAGQNKTRVEELLENGQYTEAWEMYQQHQSIYEESIFDGGTNREIRNSERISRQREELESQFRSAVEKLKKDGDSYFEKDSYEQALERYQKAQSLRQEFSELEIGLEKELTRQLLTTRVNIIQASEEETTPEHRQDEFETILEEISEATFSKQHEEEIIRKEAIRGLLEARKQMSEQRFVEAETAYLEKNYERAEDDFEEVRQQFEELKEEAKSHQLTDHTQELDEWVQAAGENEEAASRALLGVGTQ